MKYIDNQFLSQLHLPQKTSHKGQNGKLVIIGGSKLFHGASLFALKIVSRIVDMVYYASCKENQQLTRYLKSHLYSYINIPDGMEADYITQADAVLIGPGMVRGSKNFTGTSESGAQTRKKVLPLLKKFPHKKWVIDAGALQALTIEDLRRLTQVIITPHLGEFERLFETSLSECSLTEKIDVVCTQAKSIGGVIVLKGPADIIVGPSSLREYNYMPLINQTGNVGMTKGGTGDCLSGLIAALAATNDLVTAAAAAAYINGLAGDKLYKEVGPFFSADDLANQVPKTLWQELKKADKSTDNS